MIFNNVELFNVDHIEKRTDGALRMLRFPKNAIDSFAAGKEIYPMTVGRMTTGCEIRFVGNAANVVLSAEGADGTVEIYRGDFLCRIEKLSAGICKQIELRKNTGVDSVDLSSYKGAFSTDVWRIVFDHGFAVVLHDIEPITPIRPPKPEEVPKKTILAYGSSITHSAGAALYTNSYIATVGKQLGCDILCKGMGGSCYCQPEVAEYIASESWDMAILELGVNMVANYTASVFEERARYVVNCAMKTGRPVILISNFTHFNDLAGAVNAEKNESFVKAMKKIYEELRENGPLYYIDGRDIVTDYSFLLADVLHPSTYGHGEMGRRIADKIRNEFALI